MDTIWFKNPTILLKHNQIKNIWPVPKMTPEEKVNAVTRLIILLTIVGYLLTLSYKIIYIAIIAIVIICLLYYIQQKSNKNDNDKNNKNVKEGFENLTNPKEYELNKDKFEIQTISKFTIEYSLVNFRESNNDSQFVRQEKLFISSASWYDFLP